MTKAHTKRLTDNPLLPSIRNFPYHLHRRDDSNGVEGAAGGSAACAEAGAVGANGVNIADPLPPDFLRSMESPLESKLIVSHIPGATAFCDASPSLISGDTLLASSQQLSNLHRSALLLLTRHNLLVL